MINLITSIEAGFPKEVLNYIKLFGNMSEEGGRYENNIKFIYAIHHIGDSWDLLELSANGQELEEQWEETVGDDNIGEYCCWNNVTTQKALDLGISNSSQRMQGYIAIAIMVRKTIFETSYEDVAKWLSRIIGTKTTKAVELPTNNKGDIMNNMINTNKKAMLSAGRLELGKTGLAVVREFLKKQKMVPTIMVGYLDNPFGDLILANLLYLIAQQFPQQKKFAMVSEAALEAGMGSLLDSLNLPKLINSVVHNTESMGLFKELDDDPIVIAAPVKRKSK